MKTVSETSNRERWQSLFFWAVFVALGVYNEPIFSAIGDTNSTARTIICTVKYDMLTKLHEVVAATKSSAAEAM